MMVKQRLSDERLAEIEARLSGTTDGPWELRDVAGAGIQIHGVLREGTKFDSTCYGADGKTSFMLYTLRERIVVGISDERWVQFETNQWSEMQKANGHFIAHARQDIPELLAEIKRLRLAIELGGK